MKARTQQRHGTFTEFTNDKNNILPDELTIVDSGREVPTGKTDSALYYLPFGKNEPVRVANADEVMSVYLINEESVPESEEWGDQIPTTYAGRTGRAPELAFWDTSIWLLYSVVEYGSRTIYHWSKMLTSDDV